MELKKTVCYEDFGAVGDGVTDDSEAIRAAHNYANENGLDVVCKGSKTYYIGIMTKTIPIKTNVNWGDASFIIDDSGIAPEDQIDGVTLRHVFIFTIPSPGGLTEVPELKGWMERVNATGGLKADTFRKMDVTFSEAMLLRLYNDEHKNYIRYGVNAGTGAIQAESIVVDKDGVLDPNTPLMHDFDKVTRMEAFTIGAEPLTVEGGTFTTYPFFTNEPQQYTQYSRGLACFRSNVTIKNVKHYLDREGNYNYDQNVGDYGCPYTGFFTTRLCNNVIYENCTPSAHVVYKGFNGAGMGTYDISANGAINVIFKNCAQEEDNFFNRGGPSWRWGVMGSSGNKSVSFVDSKLTRFDAHADIHNVNIIGSEIRMLRINGTGTFRMENSKMYNKVLVSLREDYGGTWRGNFIIKNVTMDTGGVDATLVTNTWYNHDFGYPTYLPETIVIDNLQLTSNNKVYIFSPTIVEQLNKACADEVDGKPNVNKTVPPKKIIIRNNTQGLEFIKPTGEFFKNTEIVEE